MPDFRLPEKNTSSVFSDVRGHHVAIRVPDRDIAIQWYQEKLDWRVVHKWPYADEQLAYLAPPNDDGFMVELLGGGQPGPIAGPSYQDLGESLAYAGYHHFCLTVADIEATVGELRRRGVTIVTEPFQLDDISRKLAFFADPFGNLIELAEVI
ncbi:VOC family protein [Rhizobium leguminosarum]|uniref:VOC family protein n=1 Tax=Rhizobium TaxID=379 RepID=UPI0010313C4B|nr:VOC family protein [Rhizobium leguminosarum]TBF87481.1 VOC family protein [Rhizobium leguminosarum]TBG06957.1 VOC family protein [Rhizobium leguminosarum]TBG07828.1 VOC family protein [Rhizobium leguminosarum]TBG29994.1 VOC family protein [Rhizobium leguminosarum]TBG50127.1 VOC family protein [Rhizobium leguminosarum]